MREGDPTYYAYVHARPGTTDASGIFYVGKGRGKRGKNMVSRSEEHRAIVASFGDQKPLIGHMTCSSSDTAYELEKGIIKRLTKMGVSLVNKTAGGGKLESFTLSAEARRKISEGKMGDKNPMRRPEVAAKAHANLTEDGRLRRIEGARTPAARAKRSKSNLETWKDPEIRKRRTDGMNRPEVKAKVSKRLRENNPSSRPEVKVLRSKQFTKNWEDPILREHMVRRVTESWTTERREAFSKNNPSHDPVVNAKKSAALKGTKRPTLVCPHCSLVGGDAAMLRYHFDNCKKRES